MGFALTILEGPEAGKTFSFERVEITVGRTMENDVVLPDPSISRQHIQIRDKGGAFIVKDLGSSNGTRLNGRPIKEEVIRPGDLLELGKARLRFEGLAGKAGPARGAGKPAGPARKAAARAVAPARKAPSEQPPKKNAPEKAVAIEKPVIKSSGLRSKAASKGAEVSVSAKAGGGKRSTVLGRLGRLWDFGRSRFLQLDKRVRLAITAVAALLFVVLILKAVKGGREIVRQISDHSNEVFEMGVTDSDGAPASFGLGGGVTYRCREMVNFRFKYANGRAEVAFIVGAIDKRDELTVKLNDIPIFNIPEPWAVDKWSEVVIHKLDRKHLLENEENKLTFVNNINAADAQATEKWGVQLVGLQETPLPAPDQKVARENFELAKKRYERKDVAPENLYQALQSFEKARDYLELLPEDSLPDIYQESCEMIEKINRELNERFRAWMFDASRAVKYGRYKEAIEIYRRLLKAFPNQEDPRHQQAREKLEELE